MASFLKKILLVAIIFLNIQIEISAQLDVYEIPEINDTESPETSDSILNYFIRKGQNLNSSLDKTTGIKEALQSERCLSRVKSFADSFIANIKNKPIKEPEDFDIDTFRIICEDIEDLKKNKYGPIGLEEFVAIENLTGALPHDSKNIWLELQYWKFRLYTFKATKEYVKHYGFLEAQKAETFSDSYDKGKAFFYIANFFANFNLNDLAIFYYYKAQVNIQTSTRDKYIKFYEQGIICEKIAIIFTRFGTVQGIAKSTGYFNEAYKSLLEVGYLKRGNENLTQYISQCAYLLYCKTYRINDPKKRKRLSTKILSLLFKWETSIRCTDSCSRQIDVICLYSIGIILQSEKRYYEALPFLIEAIFILTKEGHQDLNLLMKLLADVSTTFLSIGNETRAMGYLDLAIYLSLQTNDRINYYNAVLTKANSYINLQKFDSALAYINNINANPLLSSGFDSSRYNNILEKAYALKIQLLEKLKLDSILWYKNAYSQLRVQQLEEFASLLDAETSSNRMTLVVTKLKEVAIEKELLEEAEYHKKFQLIVAIILGIILLILVSIWRALIIKNHKKKMVIIKNEAKEKQLIAEKNAMQLENEKIQLNELARNKIHDVKNNIKTIYFFLIQENNENITRAREYTDKYSHYLAQSDLSWSRNDFNLENELNLLESYISVLKIAKNIEFKKNTNNLPLSIIIFLPSVFDVLITNSVFHAFEDKTDNCVFEIDINRVDNVIHCSVMDNGKPPTNEAFYLYRQNSGLDIMKRRIEHEWQSIGQNRENRFSIKKRQDIPGTIVNFELPYYEKST